MAADTNALLESVAEAVADGLLVDWDGLLTARPEAAEELKQLRLVGDIIQAWRNLPGTSEGGAPHASPG